MPKSKIRPDLNAAGLCYKICQFCNLQFRSCPTFGTQPVKSSYSWMAKYAPKSNATTLSTIICVLWGSLL